jgi:hypothetical protein
MLHRKHIEALAVTDIDLYMAADVFNLRRGFKHAT